MRRAAHIALGIASACGLVLCAAAMSIGLAIIVATVLAHEWLEGESPEP